MNSDKGRQVIKNGWKVADIVEALKTGAGPSTTRELFDQTIPTVTQMKTYVLFRIYLSVLSTIQSLIVQLFNRLSFNSYSPYSIPIQYHQDQMTMIRMTI